MIRKIEEFPQIFLSMNIQSKKLWQDTMFRYLLLLVVAGSMGLQGWRTIFNNFAVEDVNINGFQMGAIQSIREVPGFLSLLVVFLLFIIKEHKLSALSIVILGVGIALTGLFPSFWGLVITTFVFSIGWHYFETTNQSLTLQYFTKEESPIVLAKQKSWKAISNIFIGIVILFTCEWMSLQWNFVLLGGAVVLVGLWAFFWKPTRENLAPQNKGMVVHRKYWLFYCLNFLSGARRQIFVVFAVFLMVKVYHFSVTMITILFVLNNVITFFTAPLVAKGIKRYGERPILTLEYAFMILVFLGYSYVHNAWVVGALYIVDNLFYSCAIGINTFFHKTCDPKDIAPSMAVGFTINHISAVVIPVVGGLLWMQNIHIPFIIGVILAVVSLVLVQKIPSKAVLDQ